MRRSMGILALNPIRSEAESMKTIFSIIAAAALLLSALTACGTTAKTNADTGRLEPTPRATTTARPAATTNPMATAKPDTMGDKAGNAARDAGNAVGNAVEDAGDMVGNAAKDAGNAVSDLLGGNGNTPAADVKTTPRA